MLRQLSGSLSGHVTRLVMVMSALAVGCFVEGPLCRVVSCRVVCVQLHIIHHLQCMHVQFHQK